MMTTYINTVYAYYDGPQLVELVGHQKQFVGLIIDLLGNWSVFELTYKWDSYEDLCKNLDCFSKIKNYYRGVEVPSGSEFVIVLGSPKYIDIEMANCFKSFLRL